MRGLVMFSALLAGAPTVGLAADAQAAGQPGGRAGAQADGAIETILVTGHRQGYVALNSVTATKTDTPLIDIPQTIQVVTREQLDDQALRSLADVLRYVPGTTVGQGEGNRDQITIRGQNTSADFFLDGVRDDVQYYRSLYNIERVEVLKGPYALIFGRGGGGGIINRAQKAPSAEGLFGAVGSSVNSFGGWEVSADVNAPVADNAALRFNAFHEDLDNHRDFFGGERFALNPYLAVTLGDAWSLGLSYEYVDDDRVTDRGVPALACTQPCTPGPLRGERDTFFGVPGVNRAGLEAHIVKLRLDGDLTDTLSWSSTALYGDYDKYYTNVFANGAATAPDGTVALSGYTDPTTRENLLVQGNLVWDVALGPVENRILFGLEYGNQDSTNQRRNAVLSAGSLDLARIAYPTVAFPALNRDTESDVRFVSVYAQDQLAINAHLDLVVGVRYDKFDIDGTDRAANPDRPFERIDEKVSPRYGLIYKPIENVSLYASYSRSFLPRSGDQFLTLSPAQENLAPERFTNREVGAKWDIHPGLAATLALFQLDRTNATTPDPANPLATINVGKTRTEGVELALTGRLTERWQVSSGYTWQDAALRGNGFVELAQVPEHQFSLWNRYDFTDRFGAGIGVIHQSSQFAAIRNAASVTRLPGFTRVDAALFYDVSDAVQLQANIENLFDEGYFADAHNNNNISTGAPLNGRVSVRVRF